MTAIDSSVCIPALVSWHAAHERCRVLAAGASIPAHALLESYSVLTRLPAPHRLERGAAAELLDGWFAPAAVLTAPAGVQRSLVTELAAAGVDGGASYDGLIAATARAHGEVLITRDARAARTYEALGVDLELVTD